MRTPFTPRVLIAACNLLLPVVLLCALAPDAWARRINLHFGANPYAFSTETTPATPAGTAGTWNNLTNATANGLDSFESDAAAILYSDGSPGPMLVFDSTNVALPLSNWTGVPTDAFDPAGNFNSTNPVLPAAAQQFFRLMAGGSDASPVAVGPSITTQPAPQAVSVGQTATFSVIASGKQHKLWRVDEGFCRCASGRV